MIRVIEITDLPGDGDPMEWGRRLPNGRWVYHPPYGPTRIAKRSPFLSRREPRRSWRSLWRRLATILH